MVHSPHVRIIGDRALGRQLRDEADSGIPGNAGRAFGIGRVIAPTDKRKLGDRAFKVDLCRFREMFNISEERDLLEAYEVDLAERLRVLVPEPGKGIKGPMELDARIKAGQGIKIAEQVRLHRDGAGPVSRFRIESRTYGLAWLSFELIFFRPRFEH